MPTQNLPEPDDVRSLLNSLLGRDITVSGTTAESISLQTKVITATYDREDGKLGGLVVADLALAAYAGAALSMLPIGVAKESLDDGELWDNLSENFAEVLNIASQWFAGKGNPRVALSEVYPSTSKLPDDAKLAMAAPNARADFNVDVSGYGAGVLRVLAMDF